MLFPCKNTLKLSLAPLALASSTLKTNVKRRKISKIFFLAIGAPKNMSFLLVHTVLLPFLEKFLWAPLHGDVAISLPLRPRRCDHVHWQEDRLTARWLCKERLLTTSQCHVTAVDMASYHCYRARRHVFFHRSDQFVHMQAQTAAV